MNRAGLVVFAVSLVALAAVRMPETSPRRATNQRPTTVATSAIAIDPVPSPTTATLRRIGPGL